MPKLSQEACCELRQIYERHSAIHLLGLIADDLIFNPLSSEEEDKLLPKYRKYIIGLPKSKYKSFSNILLGSYSVLLLDIEKITNGDYSQATTSNWTVVNQMIHNLRVCFSITQKIFEGNDMTCFLAFLKDLFEEHTELCDKYGVEHV